MSIALCLTALSLGYLVFYQASQAKEGLRMLGQAIGVVVMIISLLSAVCCLTQALGVKCSGVSMLSGCPMSGNGSR